MEWFLDTSDPGATSELRREIAAHLRRHAAPESDLYGAELAVGELLSNAERHAPGPAWVVLRWAEARPTIEVHDLGPGFRIDDSVDRGVAHEIGGHGLYIVDQVTDGLTAAAKRAGGTWVRAVLPVERRDEATFPTPWPYRQPLPELDEALPTGGFGKESFLRALTVQLAQATEAHGGPSLAEASVTQVGAAVGAQMEAEFRQATGADGPLTPEEVAACLVRLKAAIGGDFFVVEVSDDRIVLGNRRCPFGEAVQRAPALCRMTSAVFGGIAARNSPSGRSRIVLEERIALGDPGCRVIVELAPHPDGDAIGHRYGADPTSG